MNANNMFPSKFLKAADLGTNKPVVEIEGVEVQEIGQDKDKRPVITFVGKDKGLVCNKTNWNTLVKLFGSETDLWEGQKVRLMVVEVSFKGEMVESIRISCQPVVGSEKPKAAPATAPAKDPNDELNEAADADQIPF